MENFVHDPFLSDNAVLISKLKSKSDALTILKEELIQCRKDRDQYRSMLHDLMQNQKEGRTDLSQYDVLHLTQENAKLKTEQYELLNKLKELQDDKKLLQRKLCTSCLNIPSENDKAEKADLVRQLEQLRLQYDSMEANYRNLLDEKEEILEERNQYRLKVHRLNHELRVALGVKDKKFLDLDALIAENKYLQEKLNQTQTEKDIIEQSFFKYKNVLDSKKSKQAFKLGSSSLPGTVISYQQVQQLLGSGSSWLSNKEATLSDLKCVCATLLDNLQDKYIALTHLRKTNKVLAERIAQLEVQISHHVSSSTNGAASSIYPSHIYLDGYVEKNDGADENDGFVLENDADYGINYDIRDKCLDVTNNAKGACERYSDIEQVLPSDIKDMFLDVLNRVQNKIEDK